jgi:hypothetical protein
MMVRVEIEAGDVTGRELALVQAYIGDIVARILPEDP